MGPDASNAALIWAAVWPIIWADMVQWWAP